MAYSSVAGDDCERDENANNSYVRRSAARSSLRELAGTRLAGDPIKQTIDRISRLTGLKYSRCYEIWYGRNRRIEDFEETAIQTALCKKRRAAARNEFAELRARMARLESLYRSTDPDFFSEEIAALRNSTLRAD